MFDILLGGKFSNKCKQAVKCTKTRIVQIRNKKKAMLRFLKKDIAELIAAGHQDNAYGRIDSLIVEMNHSDCYDMIEQFLDCILSHLSTLQKQREASPEAVEAMSTLIFSAARFSDLPELCDLRRMFTKRYGSNLESFVNAEFSEKMQKKTFPEEKKLQLMQNIANEFSVRWSHKDFNPKSSTAKLDQAPRTLSLPHVNHTSTRNGNVKEVVLSKGKSDIARKSVGQMEKETLNRCAIPSIGHVLESKEKINIVDKEIENIEPVQLKPAVSPFGKVTRKQIAASEVDEIQDGLPKSNRKEKLQDKVDPRDFMQEENSRMKSMNEKPIKMVSPYIKSNGSDKQFERQERVVVPSYNKSNGPVRQFHAEKSHEDQVIYACSASKDRIHGLHDKEAHEGQWNTKPNGVKCKQHVEQIKENGALSHQNAKLNGNRNGYLVEENCSNKLKDVSSQYFDDRVEQDRQRDRPDNNGKLKVSAPPYVKPPYVKPIYADLSEDDQVAPSVSGNGIPIAVGNKNTRIDEAFVDDKPKSVRKIHRKPTVPDSSYVPSKDKNIASQITDGQNRNRGGKNTSAYADRYNDEKLKPRNSRQSNNNEDGAFVDGNHKNFHNPTVLDAGDASIDANHISGSQRRKEGRQKTSAYYGDYGDLKYMARDLETPADDGKDCGIYYGKLLPVVTARPRKHASSSRHGATRQPEQHDEEMVIDNLLMHYSKKGNEKQSRKDRHRSKIPVAHADRSSSLPTEPLDEGVSLGVPARATSLDANRRNPKGNQFDPRFQDYDQMAERVAALRM